MDADNIQKISELYVQFNDACRRGEMTTVQALIPLVIHMYPQCICIVENFIIPVCQHQYDSTIIEWFIDFCRSNAKCAPIIREKYQSIFETVCKYCDVSVARWLYDSRPQGTTLLVNYAFVLVCSNGKIDTALWLRDKVVDLEHMLDEKLLSFNPLYVAINGGHIEIIQWLSSLFPHHHNGYTIINYAFTAGNIKVLQWLYDNTEYRHDFSNFLVHYAEMVEDIIINTGQSELLEFIIHILVHTGSVSTLHYNTILLKICTHPYWKNEFLKIVHILLTLGARINPANPTTLGSILGGSYPTNQRIRMISWLVDTCSDEFICRLVYPANLTTRVPSVSIGDEAVDIILAYLLLGNNRNTLFGRATMFVVGHLIHPRGSGHLDLSTLPQHIRTKYFAGYTSS